MKELYQKNRDSQELSREERRTAWEKVQQEILEKVFATEEQKQALSECFERRQNWQGRQNPEANETQ